MGGLRPAARGTLLSRSFYLKIRNTACHDAAIRVVLGGVRCHVLRRRSRAARQLVSMRVHHALQLVHLRRPSLAMLQEFLGCAEMMVHRLACLCARPSTPAVHPSRTRSVALLAPAAPQQPHDVHDRIVYD